MLICVVNSDVVNVQFTIVRNTKTHVPIFSELILDLNTVENKPLASDHNYSVWFVDSIKQGVSEDPLLSNTILTQTTVMMLEYIIW